MRVKNSWNIDILQHILYHAHLLKQNESDKLQDSISSHVLNQATQKLLLFFLFPNRLQSWWGGWCAVAGEVFPRHQQIISVTCFERSWGMGSSSKERHSHFSLVGTHLTIPVSELALRTKNTHNFINMFTMMLQISQSSCCCFFPEDSYLGTIANILSSCGWFPHTSKLH